MGDKNLAKFKSGFNEKVKSGEILKGQSSVAETEMDESKHRSDKSGQEAERMRGAVRVEVVTNCGAKIVSSTT